MPEEPVIVTGGSVTIQFPDSFKEQTSIPGQRYFVNETARLIRVVVNNQELLGELGATDVIEIICET